MSRPAVRSTSSRPVALLVLAAVVVAAPAVADDDRPLAAADLGALAWRPIGPAAMGGRVSALALVPGESHSYYVGFATGGVFKTTNNGVTFREVFRDEATASIGAIAVLDAPAEWAGWAEIEAGADSTVLAKPRAERGRGRIVWIGTGEGNGRNSSSWGNGVYRSTDGGGSFTHVGLSGSHDIPALSVDPRDPDRALVAALGHLWGANDERGVYLTVDGGKSWRRVLGEGDDVGACEVVRAPGAPDRVFAGLYARRRTPWSFEGVSDRGGIWRSDDGGATWTELTAGLPERTGRIGIAVHAGDPALVYATIESDQGGIGKTPWDDRSPAGGLFRSEDGGDTWTRVCELNFRPFYFSRLAIDPEDPERIYLLGWDVAISDDGGRSFRRSGSLDVHVDHHAIVVDPLDPDHVLLGNDGGLYVSWDRAETWDFHDHLDVGQFYHVAVDMSDPYRVGGGLQDNGSWIGPSETLWESENDPLGGILNEDWIPVNGGDGFRVAFDPTDPDVVYATSQGGELVRFHLDTALRVPLIAAPDEGQERFRFNWDAPFLVSRHDPTVLYHAGNRVFKLTGRGDYWYAISEDLSRRETDRIMTLGSDAETYGTVTALAESPRAQGLLWAGTDDGRIHVTRDDGGSWQDVTPKQAQNLYVAWIEASHHDDGTAFAVIDGHRSDVFAPLILRTTNHGGKWREIQGDLPAGDPVRVVHEDPANPDVLYCGNETGAYVTVDGGEHWLRLGGKSLPTVPVFDLLLHPRERDLIAATHGRSYWIIDDAGCFAELTAENRAKPLHLCAVPDARPRLRAQRGYGGGARRFVGKNPPVGAVITYWLRDLPEEGVSVRVENADGLAIRSLGGPARPGLNRVVWDLRAEDKHRFNMRGDPDFVAPGEYTVIVSVGETSERRTVRVAPAPNWREPEDKAALPPASP